LGNAQSCWTKSRRGDDAGKLRLGKEVRFVGYGDRYNVYRVYCEENRQIYVTCDVKFLDSAPAEQGSEEGEIAIRMKEIEALFGPEERAQGVAPDNDDGSDTEVEEIESEIEQQPMDEEVPEEGNESFRSCAGDHS